MKWEKIWLSNITFATAFICIFFAACNKHGEEKSNAKEQFVLSDSMLKKIEFTIAKKEKVENELKLTAKIEGNQDRTIDVFPIVGGRVNGVKVNLGDYVEKGQTLATILSSDVAIAEKDLLAAESNLNIAKRKNAAANDMYKSGLVSDKDLVQSKTDLELAEGELAKAKQIIQIYGGKSKGNFEVKAPISGYILKKNITDNEDVQNSSGQPLFSIVDLEQVWVMANVYEADIQKVKVGYDAVITTLAYPDSLIYGKIDKLFSVLDPESRIMKARITINNSKGLLKPEMFARVILSYQEAGEKVCIPSSALIFDNSKNYVMVYKDKNHIETRVVDIYKINSQKTYIEHGLKEGEKIISKYQLLVYDAIND